MGCVRLAHPCFLQFLAPLAGSAASAGIEGRAQPLDALLDQHHVEAARRRRAQARKIVARSENNAPALEGRHAGPGAAVRITRAMAHLDEDQRAIAFTHDQINFATAPARRSIIARNQRKSGVAQVRERGIFRVSAALSCGECFVFVRTSHLEIAALNALAPASFAAALQAACDAAGAQHYPQGTLYVVATPIGNLADITLRALHVLQLVDGIACEDTRHTSALLRAYGIATPGARLIALHEHNEIEAAQSVVAKLSRGERIAYVSDAGTPALSDPGARLVSVVRAAGHRVLPLPGASSVTTLLSVAGLVDAGGETGFVFAGFLPSKKHEREAAVRALAQEPRAILLLEAPHRIEALAHALAPLGDRLLTVGRELTKQFEQIATLPACGFADWLAADPQRTRGEFALALHPAARPGDDLAEGERVLRLLLAELPLKSAARLAAEISGAPRNALYESGLRLRGPE